MDKLRITIIFWAIAFLTSQCKSPEQITKNHLDKHYKLEDKNVKLSIAPIVTKKKTFADSVLRVVYSNAMNPYSLYPVNNFRSKLASENKFNDLYRKIIHMNEDHPHSKNNLASLITNEDIYYLKKQLGNANLLLIPVHYNLKHREFAVSPQTSNNKGSVFNSAIVSYFNDEGRYFLNFSKNSVPQSPGRDSFVKYYENMDSGISRNYAANHSYYQGQGQFLLYDLNSGELVYNVSFSTGFHLNPKYASAGVIIKSHQFLIDQLYEKPDFNKQIAPYYFDRSYKIRQKNIKLNIAPFLGTEAPLADSTLTAIYGNPETPYRLHKTNILEKKLSTQLKLRGLLRKISHANLNSSGNENTQLAKIVGEEGLGFLKQELENCDLLLIPVQFKVDEQWGSLFSQRTYYTGAAQFALYDLQSGKLVYNIRLKSDANLPDRKYVSAQLINRSYRFLADNLF